MKRWPFVGAVLSLLWLFVQGVQPTPANVVGTLLIGLALGLPIAYLFRRFYNPRISVGRLLGSLPYVTIYLLAFLKELLTANVDVAYRVLAPSMPIQPDVIEVPLRVQSDAAITTIANSITLTPGTLTMDYDEDRNSLYVHAISARDRESVVDPIRTWEDYALEIFNEDRVPADSVPDPDVWDPNVNDDGSARQKGGDTDGE